MMKTHLWLLGALLVAMTVGSADTVDDKATPNEASVLAPGWGELQYELPQPGSYDLPVIRCAAGGKVLKADGDVADLGDFLHDKITVLSFIYTSCNDINGCPLSVFVLHQLQDRLKHNPEVAEHLRLISYSFDIKHDTPDVLREFEQTHHGEHSASDHAAHRQGAEWLFMVAADEVSLQPVLKAYSQFVIPEVNESDEKTGQFSHLLRVFLIDRQGRIRNIYSPDFLHPDILLTDIKSLLLMGEQS